MKASGAVGEMRESAHKPERERGHVEPHQVGRQAAVGGGGAGAADID